MIEDKYKDLFYRILTRKSVDVDEVTAFVYVWAILMGKSDDEIKLLQNNINALNIVIIHNMLDMSSMIHEYCEKKGVRLDIIQDKVGNPVALNYVKI